MTIIFDRFKLSPSTRVAIAQCQRTFGHHNLSLNTFKEPLGTPRPGHRMNHEPHLPTRVKTINPIFLLIFSLGCAGLTIQDASTAEESHPRLGLLLWSPGLLDAHRGINPQDGLVNQCSMLAISAPGSLLGGRHIDRKPCNGLGHSTNP